MSQQVTKSIIVHGELPVLYETWRDFTTHPQFMENVTSVTPNGPDTYHWVMEGPANTKLEWITKTTRLEPHTRIAWKTIEGDFKTSGQVTFTDLPKGQAEITVTTQTIPPDNLTAKESSLLFENEADQWEKDLRSFRAFVESRRKEGETAV